MKTVYRYDPETLEYTHEHNCQPDPLSGGYLMPPNCLEVVPSIPLGKTAIVNGEAWKYVPTKKGSEIYDIRMGTKWTCDTIDIPEGFTTLKPAGDPYESWDGVKWIVDEVRKAADEVLRKKYRMINLQMVIDAGTKLGFDMLAEITELDELKKVK